MVAAQLPSGTVTFLFTDIEGSTKLLHELGPRRYAEALDQHRRTVRAACKRHDGVEVDTQGDAFFVAFPTAPGALEAAREAQDALEIRVRMGLHTGTPLLTGEGYVGHDVHKAARIAAAGHGRQVLVSASTRALLEPSNTLLLDLGEHRLKDLSAPERIYQLGEAEFPPLKTLYRTNLPVPATPFLGRERELAELEVFIGRGDVRLLTLLGPGGTGKTRLALQAAGQAADRFPDGVFWVPLAPLRDPALVLESASQAFGSKDGLAEHIADKRLLLLLDNFEHLIGAAGELAALLSSCPNLSVVVTSRELLQLAAEQSYPVEPLEPEDGMQLFTTRARAVAPAFGTDEAVTALCERLDNLPLALELAAARVRVLSPAQLLERLGERLDLLKAGRDADPRQQTLRATIEWSHDLLDEHEQQLFARLAVFRGGCRLEAAEQVAGAEIDTLQSLVDKSLVRHTEERFWMLETIREFAWERLAASGEEAELRRRHALLAVDFAETMDPAEDDGADQAKLAEAVTIEHDNLRAALEWARDEGEDAVLLRLAAALVYHWGWRGLYQESDMWVPLALERGDSPVKARMKLLSQSGSRFRAKREFDRADAVVEEWRALAEREGDEIQMLRAMNAEALTATEKGDLDGARAQFAAAKDLAAELGDRDGVALAVVHLALVADRCGDYDAALEHSAEAVELFRELGDDGGVGVALGNYAWAALGMNDPVTAEASFREACAVFGRLGAIHRVVQLAPALAWILATRHADEAAAQLLGAAAARREELGMRLLDEGDEKHHDEAIAAARAGLGEEGFAAAWARGAAMSTEELVVFTMPS